MKTLYAKSGSLAALAFALTLSLPAVPAVAQDRGEMSRAERNDAQPTRQERREARPRAQERGGFGSDVVRRAQQADRAQQAERRGDVRAERIDRRSENRAQQVDRRSEVRADRVEQRGDIRAGQLDRRGRDGAAERVDRRSENRAQQIERRGDFRADRIENRGDVRADRADRRGEVRADRIENRGVDARAGRRDNRRDGWRDGQRDNWRGDRGGYRADQRNFRQWDRGWRGNRAYNWADYRRANRFAYRPGPYFAPFRSHRYSRLQAGFFLDRLFFQQRFYISDPWAYRLPPVYGPYQWVRYYDDVMLVDIYTGEVVDVIHDFFW